MRPLNFNYLLIFIALFFIGSISCSADQESLRDISVQEASGKVKDPTITWLDIRESEEFIALPKLPFAQHVPLSTFTNKFHTFGLRKDQTLYIICRSGNRSKRLQHYLLEQGYTKVFNILGGMRAWRKMGK